MEEQLLEEYLKLINIYKTNSSKAIRYDALYSLHAFEEVFNMYGIEYKKPSSYVSVPDHDIFEKYTYGDFESRMYVNELIRRVNSKIPYLDYRIFNKIYEKVNKKQYDKILSEYLSSKNQDLYNLYLKLQKEKRFFSINKVLDQYDSNYLTIPVSFNNSSIIILDGSVNLSHYFATVHELSHIHYNEHYKYYGQKPLYDMFNDMSEVYPTLSELIFGDYLKKSKITDINYCFELTKNLLIDYDEIQEAEYDIHFMGSIIALYFFEMYKDSPEQFKVNFEEFLRNNEGNDFKTNINSFGLNEKKILTLKVLDRKF